MQMVEVHDSDVQCAASVLMFLCVHACWSKAPCSHVVEFARAQVHQSGGNASEPMREFARVPLQDAEKGCYRLFVKYGYTVPVPVDEIALGEGRLARFPYLKFSKYAQWLLDTNRLWRLFAGCSTFEKMREVLTEFWARFQKVSPDHEVFKEVSDLSVAIPFFSHQDEGRGYKDQAILILSSHGCIGRGTSWWIRQGGPELPVDQNGFGLNFTGNTWSSQALFMTMLRSVSDQNPEAFETMMRLYAQDVMQLAKDGLTSIDGSKKIYMIHLGCKADLPALSKVGSFKRSFAHVPRQPSGRRACGGICPWCLAGQESDGLDQQGYPFEDFSLVPTWLETKEMEVPWSQLPAIMEGAWLDPKKPASFFHADIWHNLHLGVGKLWIANSFVTLVEKLQTWEVTSVDSKFQVLTEAFNQFCKGRGLSPHMTEISRATMGWPYGNVSPMGQWSKGSVTTDMMRFLEDFVLDHVTDCHEESIHLIAPWLLLVFLSDSSGPRRRAPKP